MAKTGSLASECESRGAAFRQYPGLLSGNPNSAQLAPTGHGRQQPMGWCVELAASATDVTVAVPNGQNSCVALGAAAGFCGDWILGTIHQVQSGLLRWLGLRPRSTESA